MELKDWLTGALAIWGALLSTWIFAERFFQKRPIFVVTHADKKTTDFWVAVEIFNPGPYPVLLDSLKVGTDTTAIAKLVVAKTEFKEFGGSQADAELNVVVPANQKCEIEFLVMNKAAEFSVQLDGLFRIIFGERVTSRGWFVLSAS